jgi:hypothetical protein
MNSFGSCIFVAYSSLVTGFIKLSTCTPAISFMEKLLLLPSILTLIISNFGSRRYFIVPANSANAPSPFA